MSSILKALRKLEEEKAALGEGGVDISRDILKRSATKPQSYNFWPLLSLVLLVLLIASVVFFWSGRPTPPAMSTDNSVQIPSAPIDEPATKVTLPVTSEMTIANEIEITTQTSEASTAEKPTPPLPVKVEPEASRPNGLPFLKLTGIAYRENAAERLAIINDLPVMQGTTIEGAELIEIGLDTVVLNWRGDLFSLQIEDDN